MPDFPRTLEVPIRVNRQKVRAAAQNSVANSAIAAVEAFTYKPRTEISAAVDDVVPNRLKVTLRTMVRNSREMEGLETFLHLNTTATIAIEAALDKRFLRQFMRNLVHSLETHEADEWLRDNGELVNDPHA